MSTKAEKLQRRIKRIRTKISGTDVRPRLAVQRSLKHISVQLIDDVKGHTILALGDESVKAAGNKTAVATTLGVELAKRAKEQKITKVVFDRRGHRYHGRIKALAEAARQGGLQF